MAVGGVLFLPVLCVSPATLVPQEMWDASPDISEPGKQLSSAAARRRNRSPKNCWAASMGITACHLRPWPINMPFKIAKLSMLTQ